MKPALRYMYWSPMFAPTLMDIPYGCWAERINVGANIGDQYMYRINRVWAIVGRWEDKNFKIYANPSFGRFKS